MKAHYKAKLKETTNQLADLKQTLAVELGMNTGKILTARSVDALLKIANSLEVLGYNQAFYEAAINKLED